MNETSQKLKDDVLKSFIPAITQMASDGKNMNEIVDAFKKQLQIKTNQFYAKQNALKPIGNTIIEFLKTKYLDENGELKADSKAEMIFYNMLIERGLRFDFQCKIGPYVADYLFWKFLVVELDGPQHIKERDDRRDAYMRRMGYKIMRVPVWVLMADPEAVIEAIIEAMPKKSKTSQAAARR
jgi:very-short-patch-repair endonuclease